jgi:hypothetical protein
MQLSMGHRALHWELIRHKDSFLILNVIVWVSFVLGLIMHSAYFTIL